MSKRTYILPVAIAALLLLAAGAIAWWWFAPPRDEPIDTARLNASPGDLRRHCEASIGEPRVLEAAPDVYVAIGYGLANTILVNTPDGNVVIDVGISPKQAEATRTALLEQAPGPIRAIVYTHSHIDHVGGATVWAEDGTEIWATDAFTDHFFKQYGVFRPAETRRAARQFGVGLPDDALACSGIGRPDIESAVKTGALMPTRTFSGETTFEVGGVTFHLHEAHGETHDQLFVWLPDRRVLMPGDNYYRTFPNLYTIRGTSPRPVDAWIESLDAMRRLRPKVLVPSHTTPLEGADEINQVLTNYRDGIQWVRDHVIRGANAGRPLHDIVESAGLPPHLRDVPALREYYGQLDWSARAIYTNELGWFDGRAEELYPMRRDVEARKTIALAGGEDQVWKQIDEAQQSNQHKWALRLIQMLEEASDGETPESVRKAKATSLNALGSDIANSNGRSYLLVRARELAGREATLPKPRLHDDLISSIPIELILEVMSSRLIAQRAMETYQSSVFRFEDTGRHFVVTIRRGIAEVVEGEPLPGTPEPVATVRTTERTWKELAIGRRSVASVLASGDLSIDGNPARFSLFMRKFRRGL